MKINKKQFAAILLGIPDFTAHFRGLDDTMEDIEINGGGFVIFGAVCVTALLTVDGAIHSVVCEFEFDESYLNECSINIEFSHTQMVLLNKMLAKSVIIER